MKKERVFYGTTYYHVLLFIFIVAGKEEKGHNMLIMSPDTKGGLKFGKRIKKSTSSVFDEVILLPRVSNGKYKKELKTAYWCRIRVPNILREKNTHEVYASVDSDFICQAVMHYSDTQSITYVEDGMEAYLEKDKREIRNVKMMHKMLYGGWVEEVSRYGDSSWVSGVVMTHSELARTGLTRIGPVDIRITGNIKNYVREEINKVLKRSCIGLLNDVRTVVLVPYSRYYDVNKYIQKVKCILNDNSKVGIKYHPRENKAKLKTSTQYKFKKLPNEIPFEAIMLIGEVDNVIGVNSTALKSAKWIKKEASVYSISMTSDESNNVKSKFSEMGIKIFN